MQPYRLYFLDERAHISDPPVIIECANDDDAIRQSALHRNGMDMELWRGAHLVANFPRQCRSWQMPGGGDGTQF